MKIIFHALLNFSLLFAFAPFTEAQINQAAPERNLITVTGNSEVKVIPDEVLIHLSIVTWHSTDLDEAIKAADKATRHISDLVKSFKIDPKYLQTSQISINPHYRGYDYLHAPPDYYYDYVLVQKTVTITLKDVTHFESLISQIFQAGIAIRLNHIEFRTSDLRKYRDQARQMAIKAAKEKAEAMTGELGQKIGKAVSIQEGGDSYHGWYGMQWGGGMAQNSVANGGGTPIQTEGTFALGQISVNATVTVKFELP